ncbi:class I SAM-dependent methyltransferase [Caminibacter mediatlanticus]|uniref:S-adenosylmethionine-dependent methyltransferase domain-containing protein n=1 Tax=Caminibacter mediatlanticus TB-2 TaxID=391592 RepID=A0AAI9F2Y7_9BACT|nr:class I SAM-dependent methyltransferase [Caminibacter mediatlanticus]EDM24081.1 hypothetical protein CMTB2_07496 [Caminibacter mediatlanticus TB-2]
MKEFLEKILNTPTNEEFKRLYHGRGEKTYPFLTIDSINEILFVQFFEKNNLEEEIIEFLKNTKKYPHIIIKKRFTNETFAIKGEIPKIYYAIENNIKFKLNFYNQNIGYFGDSKNARKYIETTSTNKRVLNLFAYTCGFSLFAKKGNAKEVINIDMSKSALSIGMHNHQINNLYDKTIKFLPYNILKSLKKIENLGKFDIIIIDPPTHQKGSFIASKDYIKIIKKLNNISHTNTTLLACINDPKIKKEEFISLIENNSNYKFKEKISPPKEYINSSLKSFIFSPKFI